MAEFKLNYTGSEINQRLAKVDRIDSKADLVGGKVPLSQLPDDIGGGLKEVDWETNVVNRPFYDTRRMVYYSYAENPNPLSFDCAAIGYSFYKISDLALTKEEIFGSKITINDRERDNFTESDVLVETDELIIVQSQNNGFAFCSCNTVGVCNFTFSGYSLSVDVPEKGFYRVNFLNQGMSDAQTIEFIVGGELKTLDLKYLPENMALGYDTRVRSYYSQAENPNPVSFDNEMLQLSFYKISDLILTRDEIFNKMELFVGEGKDNITPTESHILIEVDEAIVTNDGSWTFVFVNTAGTINFTYSGYPMSLDIPEPGIYYARQINTPVPEGRIFEITCGGELKTIDPKFIPADLDFDLSDYYTKVESDGRYYTKSEVDQIALEGKVDLSNYYTKGETYNKSEVNAAINNIDLTNYYTKAESNNNYYTKSNVYTKSEVDNNYYTKSEIDDVIGDAIVILDEINALIGE